MSHKYSIGQLVHATGTRFTDHSGGVHEIIRLMPESSGEFGYRIKNTMNGAQRAVGESEIRVFEAERSVSAPALFHR